MDYKEKFQKELAHLYNNDESSIIFKLLIADIKAVEFNRVLLDGISLNAVEEATFNEAVDQLKALIPIQHVLRKADFYGLQFLVSKDVLIPRPETEELVHLIISEHRNKTVDILDIGTGSGCIAITLKHKLPLANVSVMDLSLEALAVAEKNALRNGTEISFFNDDALNLMTSSYPQYDIIVSNPPYIAGKEKAEMDNLVLDNEPHLALFVDDDDALVFYDKIADFALTNLKPSGTLYFEINQNLAAETKSLIERKGFDVSLLKDLNDNFRMIRAERQTTIVK